MDKKMSKVPEKLKRIINASTPFEVMELLEYHPEQIYYIGELSNKIVADCGDFDAYRDSDGYYKPVVKDHINFRYQVLGLLGKGAFATVLHTFDHKRFKHAAIKMLRQLPELNPYEDELKIVKLLHEEAGYNRKIVTIFETFMFRQHECIVMEYLGKDLFTLINENQHFDLEFIKAVARDILTALKDVHRLNIIHGDINLHNIVLQLGSTNHVKLIDFGCSHFETRNIAWYMGTRQYRAPEILLRVPYSRAMDIWSLAVCIVELFTGSCIFNGFDEEDVLFHMVQALGMPDKILVSDWLEISNLAGVYFSPEGILYCYIRKRREMNIPLGIPEPRSLTTLIGKKNIVFINFLRQCLTWDERRRVTATEALHHPWTAPSKH